MDETDVLHSIVIDVVDLDGDSPQLGIGWCDHLNTYQVWWVLSSVVDQLRELMASQS